MKRRDDAVFLAHMLDARERVLAYTRGHSREGFGADMLRQDGVIRQLQVLGEACRGVSDDLRSRYPDVPWRQVTATRNRMVHAYFDVDLDIIWDIATSELPALRAQLATILRSLESDADAT